MIVRRTNSPLRRASFRAVGSALAVALGIFFGCGTDNAIVGGQCATGYTQCGLACVNLRTDHENCGRCGLACSASQTCIDGTCSTSGNPDGSSDGALGDGALGDGALGDGALGDGALGDGALGDGALGDGALGDGALSDGGITDANNPDGFSCIPPLVACGGVCKDVTSDPLHCGQCGRVCASGICTNSICEGASPGDIVVIGHDYSSNETSAQLRVLDNAVFITDVPTVRVLSYEQFADAANATRVKQLVTSYANTQGRNVTYTVSSNGADLAAVNLFVKFEVILIYDQPNMSIANAVSIGTTAKLPLSSFAKSGGTIVVLDGAQGLGTIPVFVKQAGLIDLTAHTLLPAPGGRVTIVASADVLSKGVVSPYATAARSVSFTSNEANGGVLSYVGRAGVLPNLGEPVILHKIAQ